MTYDPDVVRLLKRWSDVSLLHAGSPKWLQDFHGAFLREQGEEVQRWLAEDICRHDWHRAFKAISNWQGLSRYDHLRNPRDYFQATLVNILGVNRGAKGQAMTSAESPMRGS